MEHTSFYIDDIVFLSTWGQLGAYWRSHYKGRRTHLLFYTPHIVGFKHLAFPAQVITYCLFDEKPMFMYKCLVGVTRHYFNEFQGKDALFDSKKNKIRDPFYDTDLEWKITRIPAAAFTTV